MLLDTNTFRETLKWIKDKTEEAEDAASDAVGELEKLLKRETSSALVNVFKCSRCGCSGAVPPYIPMRVRNDQVLCISCYEVYYV